MNPFTKPKVSPTTAKRCDAIYHLLNRYKRRFVVKEVAAMTGFTEAQVRDALNSIGFLDKHLPIKTVKKKSAYSEHYYIEMWV